MRPRRMGRGRGVKRGIRRSEGGMVRGKIGWWKSGKGGVVEINYYVL